MIVFFGQRWKVLSFKHLSTSTLLLVKKCYAKNPRFPIICRGFTGTNIFPDELELPQFPGALEVPQEFPFNQHQIN